jgi:hypothetical protein
MEPESAGSEGADAIARLNVESPAVARTRQFTLRFHRDAVQRDCQLGIGHLLLWLTFVCVYFAIVRSQVSDAVVAALTCCTLVLPTLDRKRITAWKFVFGFEALLVGWPLLLTCLGIWFGWTIILPPHVWLSARLATVVLAALLPLLWSDWVAYRGSGFRWLHWVGLASWTAWCLLQPSMLKLVGV